VLLGKEAERKKNLTSFQNGRGKAQWEGGSSKVKGKEDAFDRPRCPWGEGEWPPSPEEKQVAGKKKDGVPCLLKDCLCP